MALYFQPFATVKLEKMARAFGWTVDETEGEVIRLIGEGEVKGRVDRLGKVCCSAIDRASSGLTDLFVILDSESSGDRSAC